MRLTRFGRPSPAMAVALVALFVALGGTAIAAKQISGNLLKPKSVSGGKLKSKTVGGGKLKQFTGGLLKKETVGGGKLKKDTLTAYQIDEERLDAVPSAKSVVGDSRYNAKLGFGQAQTLATVGSLTLTAQCIQNTTDSEGQAGRDVARVLVSTSEGNSVFQGSAGQKSGSGSSGSLQPTTPEGERIAFEYSVPSGSSEYLSGGYVTAYAPNGSGLVSGTNGNAAGLNMFGASCTFHGAVFQA